MTDPRDQDDTPTPDDPQAVPDRDSAAGPSVDAADAPEAGPSATEAPPPPAAGSDAGPEGERIAKVMSRAGVASRREAERMIIEGRVTVNGRVIDSPALDVTPADRIAVDGKPVEAPQETRLWLYYKPVGLVTTDNDEKGRQTIQDALPRDLPRVMTVGRLDLNSEGLLLLTNDGTLKRVLELPSTGWLRRYRVRVNGTPNELTLAPLKRGITIEGEEFAPMEVTIDSSRGANAWLTVGIREGRNREIRRAMNHVGLTVNRLIRIGYGPFKLADMEKNEVREVKRRVLREQLGGLMPGADKVEDATESPRKPRAPRRDGAQGAPRATRAFGGDPHAARGPRAEGDARPNRPARKPRSGEEGGQSGYRAYAPRQGEAAERSARSPRAGADAQSGRPERKPWSAGGGGQTGYQKRPPREAGAADRPARAPRPAGDARTDWPARKPWNAERAQTGYQQRPPREGAADRPARTPRAADETRPDRPARKPWGGDAAGGKGAYQKRTEGPAQRGSGGAPRGYTPRSEDGATGPRRGPYKGKPGVGAGWQGGGKPGGSGKPRPPATGGAGRTPRGPGGKPPRSR